MHGEGGFVQSTHALLAFSGSEVSQATLPDRISVISRQQTAIARPWAISCALYSRAIHSDSCRAFLAVILVAYVSMRFLSHIFFTGRGGGN